MRIFKLKTAKEVLEIIEKMEIDETIKITTLRNKEISKLEDALKYTSFEMGVFLGSRQKPRQLRVKITRRTYRAIISKKEEFIDKCRSEIRFHKDVLKIWTTGLISDVQDKERFIKNYKGELR